MRKELLSFMAVLVALFFVSGIAMAGADLPIKKVAEVFAQKDQLSTKRIVIEGKVVKVNNGIMGKNFLHVQDGSGSGAEGTNDIIVTSQQTASVGDQLHVEALVTLNRDFGHGYLYPLLLEEAVLTPKK